MATGEEAGGAVASGEDATQACQIGNMLRVDRLDGARLAVLPEQQGHRLDGLEARIDPAID